MHNDGPRLLSPRVFVRKLSAVRSAVSMDAAGPVNSKEDCVLQNALSFGDPPLDVDRGVYLSKHLVDPGCPCDGRALSSNDGGLSLLC